MALGDKSRFKTELYCMNQTAPCDTAVHPPSKNCLLYKRTGTTTSLPSKLSSRSLYKKLRASILFC